MSSKFDSLIEVILQEDDLRKELQARNQPYTPISAKEQAYIDEIRRLYELNKQLTHAVERAEYRKLN